MKKKVENLVVLTVQPSTGDFLHAICNISYLIWFISLIDANSIPVMMPSDTDIYSASYKWAVKGTQKKSQVKIK